MTHIDFCYLSFPTSEAFGLTLVAHCCRQFLSLSYSFSIYLLLATILFLASFLEEEWKGSWIKRYFCTFYIEDKKALSLFSSVVQRVCREFSCRATYYTAVGPAMN